MWIARGVAILLAMEVLVFLLGYTAFFTIGVLSGGMAEGSRMASGVFYSWSAFVAWFVWVVGLYGDFGHEKKEAPERMTVNHQRARQPPRLASTRWRAACPSPRFRLDVAIAC